MAARDRVGFVSVATSQSHAGRRWRAAALLGLVSSLAACGSSSNEELFRAEPNEVDGPPSRNDSGIGGSSAGSAGGAQGEAGAGLGGEPAGGGTSSGGGGGIADGTGGSGAGGSSSGGADNGGSGGSAAGGTGGVETRPNCGNGIIERGEECDDRNADDADGCTSECFVECDRVHPDAQRFGDHCYWKRAEAKTWRDAEEACRASAAHLVTITSEAENAFLERSWAWVWIGASDGEPRHSRRRGEYAWVTGEEMSFENWADDRPNAQGVLCGELLCYEHCAELQEDGTWNDLDCEREDGREFVCEWDAPGERP